MRILFVAAFGLLLAGCSALPETGDTASSEPGLQTRSTGYGSVVGDYTRRRPVEPDGWRGQSGGKPKS